MGNDAFANTNGVHFIVDTDNPEYYRGASNAAACSR